MTSQQQTTTQFSRIQLIQYQLLKHFPVLDVTGAPAAAHWQSKVAVLLGSQRAGRGGHELVNRRALGQTRAMKPVSSQVLTPGFSW